jgi:acetyltransferase-like isoleucine patch superfamily enzyme
MKLLSVILPWGLRRRLLNRYFKFEIHPTARIGLAWIFPQKLIMAAGAKIDHFTVAIHLDTINIGENSTIGRGNWITGFSTKTDSMHFKHQLDRKAELLVGAASSITKNHHIDCTNIISIGNFSTVAGYQSQLLTHSIDVFESRQDSKPIYIGDYTFVGTNVVILGGASLPARSVLGAKSLLNKAYTEEYTLYAGVPAKAIGPIGKEAKYFTRSEGFVL